MVNVAINLVYKFSNIKIKITIIIIKLLLLLTWFLNWWYIGFNYFTYLIINA